MEKTSEGLTPTMSDTYPLYNYSVVNTLAANLGYEGPLEMNEGLCKELNAEQIAYIIIPKKAGWSYAVHKHAEQGNANLEYCYVYWKDMHSDPNYPAAVAHELLHLFGAEDLYQSGSENLSRSELARQLHPDEIMLWSKRNISENMVGDFTAYTVGWLDEFPAVYDCEEWWN